MTAEEVLNQYHDMENMAYVSKEAALKAMEEYANLSAPKQTGQSAVDWDAIEKDFKEFHGMSSLFKSRNIVEWFKQKLSLPDIQADGKEFTLEDMRKCATQFFYHWWNTPGQNTEEGFDKWFPDYLKRLHPENKSA